MPITATSYGALISAAAVNMLAASTTFQTLVGVGSATAARAFILEDDAGQILPGATAKNCDGGTLAVGSTYFAVRSGELRRVDRAYNTYGAEGEVTMLGVLTRIGSESDTDALRRARNAVGNIRAELEAMYGTVVNSANALMAGLITTPAVELCDTTGPLRGRIYLFIEISWRDIP